MSLVKPKVKILQISSYPPPRTGWGVRIELLKQRLESSGHRCVVLNLGPGRKIKSPEYECVYGAIDYLYKIIKFSSKGYIFHAHINGQSSKAIVLILLAEFANLLFGKRCVVTFHGGPHQQYFPKQNYPLYAPLYRLIFRLSQKIICNQEAVKEQIVKYGISADKVIPVQAFTRQYLQHKTVSLDPGLEGFLTKHSPAIFSYVKFRDGFYLETLIRGFQKLQLQFPQIGLLLVGGSREDRDIEAGVRQMLADFKLESQVFEVPDLSHDAFRTVLKRSTLYLRTPTSDGVCSSVLEALSFGIPVVAAENYIRPPSVITYSAEDSDDMAEKVSSALNNLCAVRQKIKKPHIKDTLSDEIDLLIRAANGTA